jgi:large subunit ribosomal protein L24
MLRIRKGDLVQIIAGADRGKQGRVIAIDALKQRVRVAKVRMQKRHLRPGARAARQGGIIEQEGYIHASNVQLIDPKDNKPSRVRIEDRDGERVRVFCRSGDAVPAPADS